MAARRNGSVLATALAAVLVALRARDHGGDTGGQRHAPDQQEGAGRGRGAESPGQIPAPGWKDILWRTYGELSKDRVMLVAAGVTFYALLALFPALTALVSIYGLIADPATVVDHIDMMSGFLPAGAIEIIGEQMQRVASQPAGSLSIGFLAGIAVTLWSANNGMKAVIDAMNVAYNQEEKRSFIKLTLVSFAFTLAALALVILVVGTIVVLPILLGYIGLAGSEGLLLRIARWPLLLIIILGAITVIYRHGPNREPPEWRWVIPGAVVAGIFWLIASLGFSWYVSNFDSYNETYGSLGAVIAFMVWMWVSATIVIMGAELNAEMERQTRYDTTTGEPLPMGTRGAQAADTVGRSAGR